MWFAVLRKKKADEFLDYRVCTKQSRDTHFASEEKKKRYEYLKAKVMEAMKARKRQFYQSMEKSEVHPTK